jgi:hypothetical protein
VKRHRPLVPVALVWREHEIQAHRIAPDSPYYSNRPQPRCQAFTWVPGYGLYARCNAGAPKGDFCGKHQAMMDGRWAPSGYPRLTLVEEFA